MLRKWIYKFGQKIRNPSIDIWYAFLKDSEKWSLAELENHQLNKLKEVLLYAYNHSEYYRNKFNSLSLHPNEIENLSDLLHYPILTKHELLKYNDSIHSNICFKNRVKATTSGSDGKSLQFYREESADSFNRASIARGYSWFGVEPWEKNGYFWGFNFSLLKRCKNGALDTLQNRFRLFSYQDKKVNSFLKKLTKAQYLHGYSSMIYQIAKIINNKKISKSFNLKLVKGTSEKIFEKYQYEVEKAFGIRMISEYGATETGIIAFECSEGNMHINMEGVIVEEVDNEIVVTNLQLKQFPIIRYKLGDYVKLAPKDTVCKCGMKHRILDEVTGRVGQNIYGKHHIYPSLYLYYIFKNLSKENNLQLNYQVHQKKKANLLFYVSEKLNEEQFDMLSNQIKAYFSEDITFEILDNTSLKLGKSKLKNFISSIDE